MTNKPINIFDLYKSTIGKVIKQHNYQPYWNTEQYRAFYPFIHGGYSTVNQELKDKVIDVVNKDWQLYGVDLKSAYLGALNQPLPVDHIVPTAPKVDFLKISFTNHGGAIQTKPSCPMLSVNNKWVNEFNHAYTMYLTSDEWDYLKQYYLFYGYEVKTIKIYSLSKCYQPMAQELFNLVLKDKAKYKTSALSAIGMLAKAPNQKYPLPSFPPLFAYITAQTRLKLWKAINDKIIPKQGHFIMSITDSIFYASRKGQLISPTNQLGEFSDALYDKVNNVSPIVKQAYIHSPQCAVFVDKDQKIVKLNKGSMGEKNIYDEFANQELNINNVYDWEKYFSPQKLIKKAQVQSKEPTEPKINDQMVHNR